MHSSGDQSKDSDKSSSSSGEISSYARVGENRPVEAESLVSASDSDQLSGKHFDSISDDASLEDAPPDASAGVDRPRTAVRDPSGSRGLPRKHSENGDKQDLVTGEGHLTLDDSVLSGELDNNDLDDDITASSCSSDVIASVDESDSESDSGKIGYCQPDGSSYDSSGMSGSGTSCSGGCYCPAVEKPAWRTINSKAANIDPNNPVIRCSNVVTMPMNKIVTEVAGCPPHRNVSDRLDSVGGDDNDDVDSDTVASAEGKPNADESDSESDCGMVSYGRQDGSSYDASGTSSGGGCYSPEAWRNINSVAASIDPDNPVSCCSNAAMTPTNDDVALASVTNRPDAESVA